MWGDSMIGFGAYHYKYATGHEGDAMIAGFSPRKAKISLYLTASEPVYESLLERLGKHTAGKACIYINSLSDINESVLKELIIQNNMFICENYPQNSINKTTDVVDNFIKELPKEIQAIVYKLRELILDASLELVEEFKWSMPNYYYKGMVCYIQAYKRHVNLGFAKGDELYSKDTNQLLQGSGKSMRHIKIENIEDIKAEEYTSLILAAIEINKSNS